LNICCCGSDFALWKVSWY